MNRRVAVVGRPNVGKSTLFNALRDVRGWRESSKIERKVFEGAVRAQLVSPMARTTRDVRVAPGRLGDLRFDLLDTAGYETEDEVPSEIGYGENWKGMSDAMRGRALDSIATADVVLLVLDAVEGISGIDFEVTDWLRKNVQAPRLVIFNKCEFDRRPSEHDIKVARSFVGKGDLRDEPIFISAQHGDGFPDLLQALRTLPGAILNSEDGISESTNIQELGEDNINQYPIRVALVGQPNVGKSSFLNAVAASEIALVSDVPGTTRDPVEYEVKLENGRQMRLVDTAGVRGGSKRAMGRLRNRSRLNEIEAMACRATEREFTRSADVVVLFVDAAEGRIRNDDKKLAQKCIREASGPIIVAATKVDLLMSDPELNVDVIERGVKAHFHDIVKTVEPHILAVSSKPAHTYTKSKTLRNRLSPYRVLEAVIEAFDNFATTKIRTRHLNDWFRDWVKSPIGKPRVQDLSRIKFLVHTETRPPIICLHGRLRGLHPKAEGALQTAIIHNFGLRGTRLHFQYKTEEIQSRSALSKPRRRVVGPIAKLQRKAPAFVKANFIQKSRKLSSRRSSISLPRDT